MNTPLPIVYIHHERALGGAPLSLLYLLRQIDRQKYSPHIICLRDGPAADLFRKENLHVQIISGPDLSHTELVWFRWWQFPRLLWRIFQSIPLFFKLRWALKKFHRQPQLLVHLNSSTLLVGALAAKSLSIPVIWHIREPLAHGYLGFRRAILRWTIHHLTHWIIAISQNDATQLACYKNKPSSKLTVIYNFIDFDQFSIHHPQGEFRKKAQIPDHAPIILFLGGSARVKGAGVLLQAVPFMLGSLRSAHLVIAGEISYEFQLQATESQISAFRSRIHLIGPHENVPALLADASLLVFPSIVPHFARPVIEAAAMGKPVVASDLDGVRELVVRNETGILIPPNHSQALAHAVIELIQDTPRAYRLGQQGYAQAREKFDARHNAAATFAIYQQILKPFLDLPTPGRVDPPGQIHPKNART